MTLPERILGFLKLSRDWDPSLLLVMGSALLVYFIFFQWTKKRSAPFFATAFHLPTRKDLDRKLILGSALFGIGWGLAGYCPGPAIASIASGNAEPLIFSISLFAGMGFFLLIERKL